MREQAALGVDIIKVWVDDRLGKYKKLAPELYGAAIDEAHRAGLRAIAHEYYLADAKELLRRGIDAFAHGVRDTDRRRIHRVDQAASRLRAVPNLPERGVATDLGWLAKSLPPASSSRCKPRPWTCRGTGVLRDPGPQPRARGREGIRCARHRRQRPWGPHLEMADMVATGMSPAEVLVAATRNAARVFELDDAGTVAPGRAAASSYSRLIRSTTSRTRARFVRCICAATRSTARPTERAFMRFALVSAQLVGCVAAVAALADSAVAQGDGAVRGLYHFVHSTADAERGFAFYQDVLGIELARSPFAPAPSADTPPPRIVPRADARGDPLVSHPDRHEGRAVSHGIHARADTSFRLELSEFLDIRAASGRRILGIPVRR